MSENGVAVGPGIQCRVERSDATDTPNFAFLINIRQVVGAEALQLLPGHVLRRATQEEVSIIKQYLLTLMPNPRMDWWANGKAADGRIVALPENEWRYFVISFFGTNHTASELEQIFQITSQPIKIGFMVLTEAFSGGRAVLVHEGVFFQRMAEMRFSPPKFLELRTDDAAEISFLFQKLEKNDKDLIDVRKYTQELIQLGALPKYSTLLFLGYFAILESLLTHKPKDTDTIDSISRQVKQKLELLNHRWTTKLDYQDFGGIPATKVWQKMYSYRSCLAHGASANFGSGDLQPLGSHEQSLRLLIDAVKATLRFALEETQLLKDLRDC